ncbi:MAG: hypothetical protein J5X22_05140 [Candidatus Accumulibacter sp.]|uniref:Uncharacterized protein n=1 Tax=Candidatus Accumulibacter cognatus TaxID=2954383 RepID=A0A7D5SEJ5_9PROT|nr:hypothetical protein [Accumulibacter sp.]MBO3709917.1 hypothetical protein [Accumulibacter sp.]MCM8578661.1 hypothetical protein [Accumulibacter sp.]QLH50298.1 MAG: hypothetical protein HWD57_11260 [Candidatus Accumulibacter cognatus]
MMARAKQGFIHGAGAHRRTETDYMGVLLDTVTLDDWRDVVAGTLQLAKEGDPAARAWLAQYLVGKPETKAPTPLTVVVNQWAGRDPVAERLAQPLINRERYPDLHENDDWEESIRAAIAQELVRKLPIPETTEKRATAGDSGESAAVMARQLTK